MNRAAGEQSNTKFRTTRSGIFKDEDQRVNKDGVQIISDWEPDVLSSIQPADDQLSLLDFDVVKVIGKGSRGVVQLVQHKRTGQFFALKVFQLNINEEILKEIAQELKITQSSQCPFLVTSYQSFNHNGAISLVMEYMDGGSLEDFLKSVKAIPESYLSAIFRQVIQGLIYLHHDRHIIHRDLKPSNLLINNRGEVKITDFGVSTVMTNTADLANKFVRTYNYMSPERIVGNMYGCRSDIWSLGLVVLECATGKFPYAPQNQKRRWTSVYELVDAIVDQPPPALPSGSFSPELSSFISACLQKDPNSRSSAKELMEHPFLNKNDYSGINLASYFTVAGSPLATLEILSDHLGETSSEKMFHIDDVANEIDEPYPPYRHDEVWRLEGIPKYGVEASRLAEEGIHTVQELRRCIAMNPDAFHRILGALVSKDTLDTIVSHAMSCYEDHEDGRKYYAYKVQAHGAYFLFNDFYELEEVSFDGVTTLNSNELTFKQKELIDKLKLDAYENVTRFTEVDKQIFEHNPRDSVSESSNKSNVLPPDTSPESECDVFISYNEKDVSSSFISHLRASLCQKGISVFDKFDEVPEYRVMIEFIRSGDVSSKYSIFLNRKERGVSQMWYRLSQSSIGNKTNLERYSLQNKRMWSICDVLKEAPDYILTKESESELIGGIVRDALKELCSIDKEKMIGMDTQVDEILSLLCIESPGVRKIGIWGTAGIGKTTIAEKVFRRISVKYKTCVFLKDIHEQVKENGQVTVREEFLSKLFEVEPSLSLMWNSNITTCFLRSRLQCKRVLVILDDVNDFRDLETFSGNLNYFGSGSRVIITSRNRGVFGQSKIDDIYEVKPLDTSTSLLLLDSGTLESVISMSTADYRKQSLELVKFANGNPEVLKYLKSRSHGEWDQLLQEVLKTSPICIPRILRSCFGLVENEINIFLDIACFFRRMDKDDVAMLLDGCGFFAHVGFRSLVDRSLLTISHNLVDMHRFIQATGREIVRLESPDMPGKRCRLWNPEDIMDVFLYDNGTSTIEGIFLDMSKQKFDANPNIFEKLCNLRLLKFYYSEVVENSRVSLLQGLKYLPSRLRLLHWEYYPLSTLPRSFNPRNLVELNLPSSSAKKLWKGKKSLEKLKKMRLSYSYQLIKLPRLSSAANLELLDLEGCSSLLSISQSVSYLKKLVFLNLKNCSKLQSIPSTVDLEDLEVLNLSGCSMLENFPEISPNVKELYMGGTLIQEIPSSVKNLVLLEKLDLENSEHLKNLPSSICKLKHLETLNLSGCISLERFPDLSRRMKCLRFLDLSRTAIKELHSSISYMTALEELRFVGCRNLVRLPDTAWSLRFKVEFRQIDTEKFSKLWNRFGWLKKVQIS